MSFMIFLCKEQYENTLASELMSKCGSPLTISNKSPGIIVSETTSDGPLPVKFFVFERQRIENAVFVNEGTLSNMARDVVKQILPAITRSDMKWTLHVYPPEDTGLSITPKIKYFKKTLIEFCKQRFGPVSRRYVADADLRKEDMMVLNICMLKNGLWGAAMLSEKLSDPCPGGCHRMIFDEDAPSRSYLKVEEALDIMKIKPEQDERVFDLGAAPGGWSYAFLKRGCAVTAVDNGPMKIVNLEKMPGRLNHVQADGLVYEPAANLLPADWLVSDMLVATGKNFALIKNWIGGRRARKFIINIKLPQVEPYPVVKPMEDWLSSKPFIHYSMRQLYHDRQEVTLFGTVDR
ncbi:MAG: SAM-dependent methyltransferase [Victivallales bacterium]